MKFVNATIAIQFCTALITSSLAAASGSTANDAELYPGEFDYSLRLHGFVEQTELEDSAANPGNQLARLPERQVVLEMRPNLYYRSDLLDLRLRPRLVYERTRISIEPGATEKQDETDAFINEWRLGISPTEDWDVWVGRHVLLWGPAMSLNPSNPFFVDSGRANPYRELGGKDFFSLAWLGRSDWVLSFYDNFDAGYDEPTQLEEFHRTRALKLDLTGFNTYSSLNYAWREGYPDYIGMFFQTTISQAWLAFAEIGLNHGHTQLKPEMDEQGQWRFVRNTDTQFTGIGVVGLAYTLAAGPTINIEYMYNSQGWNDAQASAAAQLRQDAATRLSAGGPDALNAALTLAQAVQPGSVLSRRNYLFMQYLHPDLFDELDLTIRGTFNLDDNGIRWISTLEWKSKDNLRIFLLGLLNTGEGSEAKRYLRNQFLAGFNLSY